MLELHPPRRRRRHRRPYSFELLPAGASDDAATRSSRLVRASGEGVLWRLLGHAGATGKASVEAVRAAVRRTRRGGAAFRDAGGLEAVKGALVRLRPGRARRRVARRGWRRSGGVE